MGKEDDTGPGDDRKKKEMICVHDKGGRCVLHGEGASLHWKPVRVTRVGEGGRRTSKITREYFYKCDLDLEGKKKLRQPRLSFVKTTQPQKPKTSNFNGTDASKGHLGFSTSTEG